MNEYLFDALLIVVSVISIIITRYFIPWIKSQIKKTEYAEIIDIIEKAVRAAEQTIKETGQGKIKKAQVIAFVKAWLGNRGINITEEQLDKLIESAVYSMKNEVCDG